MKKQYFIVALPLLLIWNTGFCENIKVYSWKEVNVSSGIAYETASGTALNGVVKGCSESGGSGLLYSDSKEYYSRLRCGIPYKDGKKNGIAKSYDESGNLTEETIYKNGERNGINKNYYESGVLRFEAPYKDGKKNGIVKYYDESGNLTEESTYKNGEMNGISKSYYNGSLIGERQFRDGKQI